MANQQQQRPLFRFASMFRPTAPAPAPQPTRPPPPAPQQPVRPPVATAPFMSPATTTVRPTQPQEPTPPPASQPTPPAVTSPPSPPPPQPQPVVATSPVRPSPPSPQPTTPPTRSPVQRSSVPASPTRFPAPAPSPPLRAPSPPPPQPQRAFTLSPPSPNPRSPPTTRSPILASGQRSPASVAPPTMSPVATPPPPLAASPRMPSAAYSPAVNQLPPPPASSPTGPRSPPTRFTSSLPTSPVQKIPEPITQFTTYSPNPKIQSPPKPFQDYNPPPKPASPMKAPSPSPKTIEPLVKTAQIKPMSPLKLPKPAQTMSDSEPEPKIPIDQKKVVFQETTDRSRGYIPARHHEYKQSEPDEYGMSVLTLAGENKGAIMDLSPARKKYGFNGSPQKLQTEQSDAEKSGSGSDNESRPKNRNGMGRRSLPMTAFMNSNVQAVNNSILHNTTCSHHDPGIHLIFSGREGSKPHYLKGSPKTR